MITVDKDFIIDVDSMNYTPRVRKTRIDKKTGEQYEDFEIIGYYSNLQNALKGILDYKVSNSLANEEMSLESALKCVQTTYKQFTDLLERVVDDGK